MAVCDPFSGFIGRSLYSISFYLEYCLMCPWRGVHDVLQVTALPVTRVIWAGSQRITTHRFRLCHWCRCVFCGAVCFCVVLVFCYIYRNRFFNIDILLPFHAFLTFLIAYYFCVITFYTALFSGELAALFCFCFLSTVNSVTLYEDIIAILKFQTMHQIVTSVTLGLFIGASRPSE